MSIEKSIHSQNVIHSYKRWKKSYSSYNRCSSPISVFSISILSQIILLICITLPYSESHAPLHHVYYGHRNDNNNNNNNNQGGNTNVAAIIAAANLNGHHHRSSSFPFSFHSSSYPISRTSGDILMNSLNSIDRGFTPSCPKLRSLWLESINIMENIPLADSLVKSMIKNNPLLMDVIFERLEQQTADREKENTGHIVMQSPNDDIESSSYWDLSNSRPDNTHRRESSSSSSSSSSTNNIPGDFVEFPLPDNSIGGVFGKVLMSPDQSDKQQSNGIPSSSFLSKSSGSSSSPSSSSASSSSPHSLKHNRILGDFGNVVSDQSNEIPRIGDIGSSKKDEFQGTWHDAPIDLKTTN
ncbi:uncharacterized protein LOC141850076 [Brevipalpus obovatus]|uniref:uncharacterized protein LOC141850076 n=1 Tax=Brevipalpus obovatus TaxID=246614 RepID=UPI003D9EB8A0